MTRDARVAPLTAELDALEARAGGDPRLSEQLALARTCLTSLARPFDERAQPEHVTASGFVVSSFGVVLLRHRLLGLWVQPGGHVEPDEHPHDAVVREVREETGLSARHADPPLLVDVDVHTGPRAHRHVDCRWLLVADGGALRPGDAESEAIGWYLPEAAAARCEPGLVAPLRRAVAVARGLHLDAVASWPP